MESNKNYLAKARQMLDEIFSIHTNDISKAMEISEKTLELIDKIDDKEIIAEIYFRYGYLKYYKNEYQTAYNYLSKAAEILIDMPNSMYLKVLNFLGNLFTDIGEYERALFKYELMIKIKNKINDKDPKLDTIIKNNMGEVYRHLGDYETALELYSEVLEIYGELEKKEGSAYSYINIAHCYYELGNKKRALKYAEEGMFLAQFGEEIELLPEIYFLMYKLVKDDMPIENSEQILKEGLVFCEKLGECEIKKNIYECLIEAYLGVNDLNKADSYLEKMNSFLKVDEYEHRAKIAYMYATYYEKNNIFDSALEKYKEAHNFKQKQEDSYLSNEIETLTERYQITQAENAKEIDRIRNVALKEKNKELKEKSEVLNRILGQLSLIETIGQYITSTFDFEEIFTSVYLYLYDLMDVTVFAVGTKNAEKNTLEYNMYIEQNKRYENLSISLKDRESFAIWAINNREPILLEDVENEYDKYIDTWEVPLNKENLEEFSDMESAIFCPLMVEDEFIGLLTLQSYDKFAYEKVDFEIVKILSAYIAIALNNSFQNNLLSEEIDERKKAQENLKKLNNRLKNLSIIDELTKTYNRRFLTEKIADEWYKASRSHKPVSLIILDVDKFKQYNDTYGHLEGDLCLKKVSMILMDSVKRELDVVARYGGDEFVALLPNTDLDGASILAERMRKGVEALKIEHKSSEVSKYVTITLGVASIIPDFHDSHEKLLRLADEALYRAKSKSRNVVVAIDTEEGNEEL